MYCIKGQPLPNLLVPILLCFSLPAISHPIHFTSTSWVFCLLPLEYELQGGRDICLFTLLTAVSPGPGAAPDA